MTDTVTPHTLSITVKKISLWAAAFVLFALGVSCIPNVSPWFAVPVVLLGLVGGLGMLVALNVRIRSSTILENAVYAYALGLGYVLIGGLALNVVLLYVGVAHPLALLPLVLFFGLSALALVIRPYFFDDSIATVEAVHKPNAASIFFGLVPLLFVAASAAGAEILNNGGSGTLTLVMLFGVAVYAVALVAFRRSAQPWVYISAIYSIGLSVLLMYSLRSNHIFGWDINQEYQVFQMTLQNLAWKLSYYPGSDYNACLSITILPTIFAVLTRMPAEYVFKIIFQLLFAGVPLMVYAIARRYLSQSFAFLAAFFLISQTWFFEQMPALIRQETAFVFYLALLLAIFDIEIKPRTRYILLSLFSIAVVISHYSTAYVLFGLLFGSAVLLYAGRIFIKPLARQAPLIHPFIIIGIVACLYVWEVPLTHTGSALSDLATDNGALLATSTAVTPPAAIATSALPVTPASGVSNEVLNVLKTVFFVGLPSPGAADLHALEEKITQTYQSHPSYTTYADASSPAFNPVWVGPQVSKSIFPESVSSLLEFLVAVIRIGLVDILPIVGIMLLGLRAWRNTSRGDFDFIFINLAGISLLVLLLFIPYLQHFYNFTRLYLQVFFTLSVVTVLALSMLSRYMPRYGAVTAALLISILFCSLTGAIGSLTGADPRLTFSQPPGNLDTFYIYDSEVASARWLNANRDKEDEIQLDGAASLRLASFANIGSDLLSATIFPEIIGRERYVYLDHINTVQGITHSQSNNPIIYTYPTLFLNEHKALIYDNGGSRIYR